jgi:hypothetical protein
MELNKTEDVGYQEKKEETEGEIVSREAEKEEKENLENRISKRKKESLKSCVEIFNQHCKYPWYVTGSIAFLITAQKSEKQADDIDIIFHEKDFEKISKIFSEKWGFKSGTTADTDCNYIKGNVNGVEVEAFAQRTDDKPNGLINPGAKDTSYKIIRNSLEGERFNSLGREAQIELYFKNLISEIENFSLEKSLKEKDINTKSNKFISRLANLFELNNNDNREIMMQVKKISEGDPKKRKLLREFLKVSNEFKSKNRKEKGQGLSMYFNDGKLQPSLEKLKEEISIAKSSIINDYRKIKSMITEKENKEKIKQEIYNSIHKNRDIIDEYLNLYKEINFSDEDYKDLPIYIFINRFNENYVIPFCQRLEKLNKEL